MALSEEFNLDFKFGGNSEFLVKMENLLNRIDARFDSFSSDLDEVNDTMTDVADASRDAADGIDDLTDSFKSGMGALSSFGEKLKDIAGYYLSFQAARMGVERVWSFGMTSMDAYSTQERAENQLKGVLQNRGSLDQFQTIKDFAAEIQGRSIYGDEAMIKGAGELATYVKGTESLKSMMTLLTNYAAGMTGGGEVSPEQMESLATGLGMAYDGNYMAMRRKGFDTSKLEALDAIVETGGVWGAKERKKYGDVLDASILAEIKAAGGVTEQMRVDALKESLADWDNLSNAVNGLDSSALIRFTNKMGDLREEIGKKIYPVFNKLVDTIDTHMPEIEEMFNSIGDVFETIADTIEKNIGKLIDFGEWVAEIVPEVVDFFGEVGNSVGKFIDLKDAFKLLASYLVASQVREFANAFNQAFVGDGESTGLLGAINQFSDALNSEKGLTGAIGEFTKSAAAAQLATLGIAWGLKQISELGDAWSEYVKERRDSAKRDYEAKVKAGALKQLDIAYSDYKSGKISESEYKKKYELNSKFYGDVTGSKFDVWSKNEIKKMAKDAQKNGKANIYQDLSTTNIEQKVSVAAEVEKIGLLLNQSVRALIMSQMRKNKEIALTAGV